MVDEDVRSSASLKMACSTLVLYSVKMSTADRGDEDREAASPVAAAAAVTAATVDWGDFPPSSEDSFPKVSVQVKSIEEEQPDRSREASSSANSSSCSGPLGPPPPPAGELDSGELGTSRDSLAVFWSGPGDC